MPSLLHLSYSFAKVGVFPAFSVKFHRRAPIFAHKKHVHLQGIGKVA
jgi:hypothetical protein